MTRTKKLAANYRVPQDRDEADGMIRELGETRRAHARLETQMNDALAELKERFETEARPLKERGEALLMGLETFANASRDALTRGGRTKTVEFGNGRLSWRLRPPRVSVRSEETVIETLKALGLARFIRLKETVNREAILAEPAAAAGVKGIAVGSEGEDFVVEPFEEALSGEVA